MKRYCYMLLCLLLISAQAQSADQHNGAAAVDGFEGTWVAPREADIPNTPEGDRIRYGKLLLSETYKYLGAQSATPYTGNKLSCSNCHLGVGTVAYGGTWAVASPKYAGKGVYSSRSNEYRTLPIRINGCMQRSMASPNAIQLPENSEEMQSMIAYFDWLSTGIQVADWRLVKGQGFIKVTDMARAADPVRGQAIYHNQCARCHGQNGQGVWNQMTQSYRYPALWGADSFNNAAGMNRVRTGVGFVKGNMPLGKAVPTDTTTQLSGEDAWDVMAYVVSHDRQRYVYELGDWSGVGPDGVPNWIRKKVDAAYPNYYPRSDLTDNLLLPAKFSPNQHKYGPWAQMLSLQKTLINAALP